MTRIMSSEAPIVTSSRPSFLKRIKVKGRIYSGFSAVLLIMGVAVGAAVWGLDGGLENFAVYSPVAANSTRAVTVEKEFLETRRQVRTFLAAPSDEAGGKLKEQGQLALTNIDDLIPRIVSPERRKMLEEARADVVDYVNGLEQVVADTLKVQKDRAEIMDVLGAEMVKVLTEEHDQAATAGNTALADQLGTVMYAVMDYRLDVMRYLDRGIKEAGDQIPTDRAAIEKLLDETRAIPGSDSNAIAAIEEDVAAYADATADVVATNGKLVDLVDNVMSGKGREISDGIATFVAKASDALAEMDDETRSAMELAWTVTLAMAGIAVTLGLLTAWLVGRSIVNPVTGMTGAMTELAGGNKQVEIPGRDRGDEIGEMAGAVLVFKDNMIEAERLRAEQEEAKKRAEAERRQMMLDLADKFEASVGHVVDAVTSAATELQATAQSLSATAEETSQQSNAVAAASEQMTQNVQTVASATEELSSSIREIGNQVTESSRIVGSAVTQADDTNGKVKALAEAAQRIGDVVTLINEIAGQTNLLALNATIEAARAGEMGKGFAVVASEVKNLATQTAKATDEISGQIRAIQDATTSSAQAIDGITQTISRVNEISTAIASAVEEQGAATQEIARNVQEASSGTAEVSSNIGGVTQASQQTSAGATQVLSAASELARNGEKLRQEVGSFLATVRAA